MTEGRRARRVAEQIRAYLGVQLTRSMEDPRLSGLVVTDVDLGDDLGIARVKFVLLVGDDDPRLRRLAVSSVQGAAGRLRRGLSRELNLKRLPELRFDYDRGPAAERQVQSLLDDVGDFSSDEDEDENEGTD